jgi:hypothetical protein
MASSSSYDRDTAIEPNRGLTAASTQATGPSGGGVFSAFFILGWFPRGRAMASATAASWSLAGLVHPPGGGRLCHHLISAAEPAAGWCSAHHRP